MRTDEQRANHAAYMAEYIRKNPEQREKARLRAQAWREANRERHRAYSREWIAKNPERSKASSAAYRAANPGVRRTYLLERQWGIPMAEYDRMLAAQDGHCFFCTRTAADEKSRHLVVDHDHATGAVRGLLCYGCNISLGYYERGQRSRLRREDVERYLA